MTKVLDDNDIYDNDENNVVGPKKDHGMPTTFPKPEHKKHDIKAKHKIISKIGMRGWTHFSTRICYFAVKWFGTSEAKIVERLSHNKATVGTEKQRLEC